MADSGDFARRYRGWTYQQCSLHALALVKRAAETERWFDIVDELTFLREHMAYLSHRDAARNPAKRPRGIFART